MLTGVSLAIQKKTLYFTVGFQPLKRDNYHPRMVGFQPMKRDQFAGGPYDGEVDDVNRRGWPKVDYNLC